MAHGTTKAILGLGANNDAGAGTGTNTLDTLAATTAELAVVTAAIAAQTLHDTVQVCPASATNAIALDASLGHVVTLTLTEDTTITISNLTAGQSLTIVITQHASSAKTVAFASTFFAGGTEPTVSTGASAVDIFTILKIGSQLYGFTAGQDLKT